MRQWNEKFRPGKSRLPSGNSRLEVSQIENSSRGEKIGSGISKLLHSGKNSNHCGDQVWQLGRLLFDAADFGQRLQDFVVFREPALLLLREYSAAIDRHIEDSARTGLKSSVCV